MVQGAAVFMYSAPLKIPKYLSLTPFPDPISFQRSAVSRRRSVIRLSTN